MIVWFVDESIDWLIDWLNGKNWSISFCSCFFSHFLGIANKMLMKNWFFFIFVFADLPPSNTLNTTSEEELDIAQPESDKRVHAEEVRRAFVRSDYISHKMDRMKAHRQKESERLESSRRKFRDSYPWKNASARSNKKAEKKAKEHKTKKYSAAGRCEHGEAQDGYCFLKPNKYRKPEKEGCGKSPFWSSLPAFVRKQFGQTRRLEKVFRNLGSDIVRSKVFKKVMEEVPKKLKVRNRLHTGSKWSSHDCSFDWSIERLIDWLIDDWLVDWLIDGSIGWLIDWWFVRLIDWLILLVYYSRCFGFV